MKAPDETDAQYRNRRHREQIERAWARNFLLARAAHLHEDPNRVFRTNAELDEFWQKLEAHAAENMADLLFKDSASDKRKPRGGHFVARDNAKDTKDARPKRRPARRRPSARA